MSGTHSKAPSDDGPYELIYWPGIPGRGEFVRLLFEESGVPYNDLAKVPSKAIEAIKAQVASNGDDGNPPAFACPLLKHGDLVINQTPNIIAYLAPRLGLSPDPAKDNAFYHLNAIALTALDGLSDELHEVHHPVAAGLYYEDQKAEAKRRADSLKNERLPKFLAYFQKVLDAKTSGEGPWFYGGELTFADLVFFQGLHGTTFAFPKTVEKLRKSGKYDGVFTLYDAVQERPKIKAYMASDRRVPYGNGIWRHYPELEEE